MPFGIVDTKEEIEKQKSIDPKFAAEYDIVHAQYELIWEIIKIRKSLNLTQEELAKICGLRYQDIARLESFKTNPQIDTILKVLLPLGKTLASVPIKNE